MKTKALGLAIDTGPLDTENLNTEPKIILVLMSLWLIALNTNKLGTNVPIEYLN